MGARTVMYVVVLYDYVGSRGCTLMDMNTVFWSPGDLIVLDRDVVSWMIAAEPDRRDGVIFDNDNL